MGDTILLSSTVELLKSAFPKSEISVLIPEPWRDILVGNPQIKNLWNFDFSFSKIQEMRAQKFDYFLQLHASPGSKWLSLLSGARVKLAHYQNSETEKDYGKHPNALEWDRFFLQKIWSNQIPSTSPLPKVYLSDFERTEGMALWNTRKVDPKKVLFLGLGASRETKRWWPTHFARLAELARDRLDLIPAFVVALGEEEYGAQVINELRVKGFHSRPEKGGFVHFAGLSLRELMKVMAPVRAYVGNDSGPKHLAVALGIPTFTLFGPEDPVEWHPYSIQEHPYFFLPGLDCRKEDNGRWCGVPVCAPTGNPGHRCMGRLDPLDIILSMEKKLRGAP